MDVESFHMVKINMPAGVGAPPLDTQLLLEVRISVLAICDKET